MYLGPVEHTASDVEGEHDGTGTDGGYLGVRAATCTGTATCAGVCLRVELGTYLLAFVMADHIKSSPKEINFS
jgi:hypothetical protein